MRRILRLLTITLAIAACSSPQAMEAYRAHDFIESMGICVKVFDDARHDTIVKPRLQELGIKHLRVKLKRIGDNVGGNGEIQLRRIKELGEAGFKITGLTHCWYTMQQFHTTISFLLPRSINQIEGPNEPWHANENFSWENQGWPMGPILFMEDLDSMLQSDPATSSIPVLSYSGTTTTYGSIEKWIDYGNEHIYPVNGKGISQGNELQLKIDRCRATQSPTKPLQFTETGYNTGSGYQPTSTWTQTRGAPRLFLEGFRHGLKRFFLYALLVTDDAGFSLLDTTGTPKPAFRAVRDMITILRDPDSVQVTQPIGIQVTSATTSMHSLLLQRGDGTYFLCLWNDVDGWNEQLRTDITNPDVKATVTLSTAVRRIDLYRPVTHGATISDSIVNPGSTISVDVPDHPVILQFALQATTAAARSAHPVLTAGSPHTGIYSVQGRIAPRGNGVGNSVSQGVYISSDKSNGVGASTTIVGNKQGSKK